MELHPKKINHDYLTHKLLKNNNLLFDKISQAATIEKDEVPEILKEVIRFLNLVAWSEKKLTPPLLVDYAWHELILFTALYHKFCYNTFGKFIHHHPGGTKEENNSQAKMTLKLYSLYFGQPPEKYWGKQMDFFTDANCGACESLAE